MRAERCILRSMPARLLLLVVRSNPLALWPDCAGDLVPARLALFCIT
jgi:hypothetical protein